MTYNYASLIHIKPFGLLKISLYLINQINLKKCQNKITIKKMLYGNSNYSYFVCILI